MAAHRGRARRERGTRPRARAHRYDGAQSRFYVSKQLGLGAAPLLSCRATHRLGAAATAIMQGDPPAGRRGPLLPCRATPIAERRQLIAFIREARKFAKKATG